MLMMRDDAWAEGRCIIPPKAITILLKCSN